MMRHVGILHYLHYTFTVFALFRWQSLLRVVTQKVDRTKSGPGSNYGDQKWTAHLFRGESTGHRINGPGIHQLGWSTGALTPALPCPLAISATAVEPPLTVDLMTSCWNLDSHQRSKFENLQCDVSELLEAAAGYMELRLSLNWKNEEVVDEGEPAAEL